MSDRRREFLRQFLVSARPPVVDFLEKNIVIPRSMSPAMRRDVPFALQHQGFARHLLECANPSSGITDVVVNSATQVFKTFGLLMMLVYRIVNVPSPKLIVFPTKDTAQKFVSRKKLQPLINLNPVLAERKPADSDRFTDMEMELLGGSVRLTGTNSPANLASTSEQDIFQDECCKFEHHENADSPEAHPMDLADERAKSFGRDAFRYKSSSPNHAAHPFWIRFEAGSQTHFLVACPNCRHRFPFEDYPDKNHDEKHIGYEKVDGSYQSLVWSPDAKDARGQWVEQKVRETIRFICPSCAFPIGEDARLMMLDDVEAHHLNPAAASTFRSFRLPSFYAPALTFGDVAWNRIKPSDLFDNHQNHQNSWLANCWQEIDANIKDDDVRKLRDLSDYRRGIIPRMPFGLALCADVGDYKCEWEVAAIFDNGEIAVIDWGTTLTIEDLNTLQGKLRYTVDGTTTTLACSQGLVDSRDQKLRVYEMCQRSRGFWWPADGADADHGHWGLTRLPQYGLDLFTFNTTAFKTALYKNAIKDQQAPRFYLPRDADEDLIRGHSGQQLMTINGRKQWKKIPHDHFGDCSLRAILAKLIFFWKNGRGAPDIAAPQPPAGGSFPVS